MRTTALLLAGVLLLVVVGVGTAPAAASSGENVTLYRVTDADLDGADAVEAAIENGTVDPAEKLAAGDGLLVVVDSERLASDIAARNGSTTERFFAALGGEADLRMVQSNPSPERATKLARFETNDTAVYRNGTTTYVLVDTGGLAYERTRSGENEPTQLRDGDRFSVTFGYNLSSFPTPGPEIELYTAASEFSDRATSYETLPPERVNRSVRVNVEPEESLVVRLALEGGRTVAEPVEPVEWTSDRGVTLDLRDVEPGTDYTLELRHDGTVVEEYNGTVLEPTATVRNVTVAEVGERTVVNVTAELSHGGEIRVLNEEGELLGRTSLTHELRRVEPGVEADFTLFLDGEAEKLRVRAAREPGAGDEFYRGANAERTVDFGDREIQTPTRPSTETATATPTATAGTDTTPADEQAGFGAAVAVGALFAVGLLAWRRPR